MRSYSSLAPWPIVERDEYRLESNASKRVLKVAETLHADEPALTERQPYGSGVKSGWRDVPTLYLEDHRSIQLQPLDKAINFEYRSFALSSPADIYLRTTGRVESFERYIRDNLAVGADKILTVDIADQDVHTLPKACLKNTDHLDYLASRARQTDGLNICPFLVDDDIWLLADELHRRSNCLITVMGPTPRLAARANDKLWFYDMASAVLGRAHLPRTWRAYTMGAAVAELRYLAQQTTRVVLKTTSSAGSQGNLVFRSKDLLTLSAADCHKEIESRLLQTGWHDDYPLLTATWESPVLASPSAQVWIPLSVDGLPIMEGLFTQSLSGQGAGFIGARLATLTTEQRHQMVHECGLLARCLQQLGYFGRVSFDAIIVGDEPELHWIECNARWGGVSIPMTVSNSLTDTLGYAAANLQVIQKAQGKFGEIGFSNYLENLGADLLNVSLNTNGIVCLTPVGEPDTTAALFVLSQSDEEATRLAEKVALALTPRESSETPSDV